MSKLFSCLALSLLVTQVAMAADVRTWTDWDGNTVRATYVGVRDGQVMLRNSGKSQAFMLSSFSLDDRDYLADFLLEREQKSLLIELMTGDVFSVPADTRSLTLYDVPIPSKPLLVPEPEREWTDLAGDTVRAEFLQMQIASTVVLKQVDAERLQIPLSRFSRDDINYIRETIARDSQRTVFREGLAPPLTREQSGLYYRTWTDRDGNRLNARLLREGVEKDTIVLEGDDGEFTISVNGLAARDRPAVIQELRNVERRRQNADARARLAADAERRRVENERQNAGREREREERKKALDQQLSQLQSRPPTASQTGNSQSREALAPSTTDNQRIRRRSRSPLGGLIFLLVTGGLVALVAFYVRSRRQSVPAAASRRRSPGTGRKRRRSGGRSGGGGSRRGVRCPGCANRYDPGIETDTLDDMPEEMSIKVVCPACGQWLRLPENEAIPDPGYPPELTREMQAQATLIN